MGPSCGRSGVAVAEQTRLSITWSSSTATGSSGSDSIVTPAPPIGVRLVTQPASSGSPETVGPVARMSIVSPTAASTSTENAPAASVVVARTRSVPATTTTTSTPAAGTPPVAVTTPATTTGSAAVAVAGRPERGGEAGGDDREADR